jgi:rod shape-determining protein MreC
MYEASLRDEPRFVSRIAMPVRGLAHRFTYLGLIVAAFGLMMIGKVDAVLMERARTIVTDSVAPIMDTISRPVENASQFIRKVEALWGMYEDNETLRGDNARLIQWQAVARHLEAENLALKELLQFSPEPDAGYVSARVIADTGGAFAHSLLLGAGSRQHVTKGQAVITGAGLVGRIAGVGTRSSRILLITDLSSRIPVVIEPGRHRAILAGDNTDRPRLIHMTPGTTFNAGDLVVTSGHGGAFPVGIAVGVVSEVNEKGGLVTPFVERDRLEVVRVVDFGLDGILRAQPIEERPISAPAEEDQSGVHSDGASNSDIMETPGANQDP